MRGARRFSLQVKLVVLLLLLSLVPLVVTVVLVGNIGEVAQNFARNHVAELRPHLEQAQDAYRELIASKKDGYQEVARRLVATMRNADLDPAVVDETFDTALRENSELLSLVVSSGETQVVAERTRDGSDAALPAHTRELEVRQAIGVAGQQLTLVFAADMSPVEDLQALGKALAVSRRVDKMQSSLPDSYRIAFLLLVSAVVVVVTAIALYFARKMTRRIDRLVLSTRRVAKGDLEARVDLDGHDEMAELAAAFNTMLIDLQNERQKILYLQRIGAWQDVARKLAHEIKNPLTPIQLAVQQLVSSYTGEDERYRKLLATCGEIVHEEVDGLRRLVDAFRDLGRLPKVEATELSLAIVAQDLQMDPVLSEFLEIDRPSEDVLVCADRLLLRRVLVNLIENGVHAGQEAGRRGAVRVCWRAVEGMAQIVIDDEGGGVPEAKREQIFDPYVTSKETGTGLGLAIAKKIALDHRGNLYLSPDLAPSGGARFVLEIPLSGDESVI